MLGLESWQNSRKASDMAAPKGLQICPRCRDKGCQICNWSGETTARHLRGYRAWQLEYDPTLRGPIPIKEVA